MKEIEVEGKDIEEAVCLGLKKLNVSRDKVDIRVLDEGKSGLFGLMGSCPARVKMIIKEFEDLNTPKDINDYHRIEMYIKEKAEDIIKLMELEAQVHSTFIGGRIMIEIKGNDASIIIGKGGQTLDALEMLLNFIVCKEEKARVKISVDIEGYKAKREEKLREYADSLAKEVKSSGQPFSMKPMNPAERRIVHLALEHDKEVETISDGEGLSRYIIIKLKKAKGTFR